MFIYIFIPVLIFILYICAYIFIFKTRKSYDVDKNSTIFQTEIFQILEFYPGQSRVALCWNGESKSLPRSSNRTDILEQSILFLRKIFALPTTWFVILHIKRFSWDSCSRSSLFAVLNTFVTVQIHIWTLLQSAWPQPSVLFHPRSANENYEWPKFAFQRKWQVFWTVINQLKFN